MIYFDNAATGGRKSDCVIRAAVNAMQHLSANPGRSGHSLSLKAGMLVYSVRKKAARLLGSDEPERIVFTENCTHALNTAILGTVVDGGNVVTTALEHNSVLRPLFELQRQGRITVHVVPPDESGSVCVRDIENAVGDRTYLVAVNHIGNVTGAVNPIDEIGKLCRRKRLLFLVDGAQSVGYGDVDMAAQNIDMLAVAPHKGLGAVQGVGILALGKDVSVRPLLYGGTGTRSESVFQPDELPEALESGTLPTPAIAALGAAIGHNETTRAEHRQKLRELHTYLSDALRAVPGVTLYTAKNASAGIVSFTIDGIGSMEASTLLSEQYDVAVRGGLHCAPLIHRHLGTLRCGIIRASLGYDNTFGEAEFFLRAVREIAETERSGRL